MPKYRQLHTKIIDSRDFSDMPDDFTRVMWMLLPLRCDRDGRAIADSQWLRSMLFPRRRDVTCEQIEASLSWLSARGMVQVYEVNAERFLAIPTWDSYQSGTDKEATSVIPAPPEVTPDLLRTNSGVTPDLVPTNSASITSTSTSTTSTAMQHQQAASAATEHPADPAPEQKPARKRSNPPEELLVTSIAHGPELQAVLDKHFSGLAKPVPAWIAFASTTQRDAFQAAATALDGEFIKLVNVGLARSISQREKMLAWLEGCVRNKKAQPTARGMPGNRRSTVAEAFDLVDQIAAEQAARGPN